MKEKALGPPWIVERGFVGKLCGPNAIGPTPNRARWYVADELPTSFDLIESDEN